MPELVEMAGGDRRLRVGGPPLGLALVGDRSLGRPGRPRGLPVRLLARARRARDRPAHVASGLGARFPPVHAGRVYLAEANQYFNRPGPRLVETLEILAEMLHPKPSRSATKALGGGGSGPHNAGHALQTLRGTRGTSRRVRSRPDARGPPGQDPHRRDRCACRGQDEAPAGRPRRRAQGPGVRSRAARLLRRPGTAGRAGSDRPGGHGEAGPRRARPVVRRRGSRARRRRQGGAPGRIRHGAGGTAATSSASPIRRAARAAATRRIPPVICARSCPRRPRPPSRLPGRPASCRISPTWERRRRRRRRMPGSCG